MCSKLKNVVKDENGFAFLAFGFFILVLFVVGSYAYNILQEPTEMEIIVLTKNLEIISDNGDSVTYNIWAEIKNVGAQGTSVIVLKCYDVNKNVLYEDEEIIDLEKNQRANTSHIVEIQKDMEFDAEFYISKTIEDTQSIEPLSPQLPITRP